MNRISIDDLVEKTNSKYGLVILVSKRARELKEKKNFAKDKRDYNSIRNIGKAMEEINEDLVDYTIFS